MASLGSGGEVGGREELKSQFSTREGTYRLASAVEFARTTRPLPYVAPTNNTSPAPGSSPPVRISFVTHLESGRLANNQNGAGGSSRSSPDSPHHGGEDPYFAAGSNGSASNNGSQEESINPDVDTTPHRFCLNIGKELFVYPYMGVRKVTVICVCFFRSTHSMKNL